MEIEYSMPNDVSMAVIASQYEKEGRDLAGVFKVNPDHNGWYAYAMQRLTPREVALSLLHYALSAQKPKTRWQRFLEVFK